MRTDILKWLTWEDLVEIVRESDAVFDDEIYAHRNPDETYPTAEAYYREVLRRLRMRYGSLPPINEVYPSVLEMAEEAAGWRLTDGRCRENTLIHCLVTYKLHNDGYSYGEIGKMMNRDHSTITHYYLKMRDMLSVPYAYRWEIEVYKRFEDYKK